MCRKVPYGFEKAEETLRPSEEEAAKVRAFFERYLAGASLKDAAAGIPLSPPTLRGMMRNDLYAEIVGEETLALARAEAKRRTTHNSGWVRRKEQIVIPTRFTKTTAEETFTNAAAEEIYRRVVPVW